jgi:hypothetical protein
MKKGLLILVGLLSLLLGLIGIFVPGLPTTPFLLLSAACFSRSSEKLYRWLMNNRWFGSIIRNYREHRAVSIKCKVTSLIFLWCTIGYTALFHTHHWGLRLILASIAVGVTFHLLKLKTFTPDMVYVSRNVPILNTSNNYQKGETLL